MKRFPVRELAETLIRRPLLSRPRHLPIVIFTGDPAMTGKVAGQFVATFADEVPYAEVTSAAGVPEIVNRAAGEDGDLGRSGCRFLPAPRFPLAQFVLTAVEIGRSSEPSEDAALSERARNARFAHPLKEWRRRRAPWRSCLAKINHVSRSLAIHTAVAAVLAIAMSDLLSLSGWSRGMFYVVVAVTAVGAVVVRAVYWASGTYKWSWFGHQPYLSRRRRERTDAYARRISCAGDDIDPLLINAMLQDLRVAYKTWPVWPGWGRAGHACLLIRDADPGTPGHAFLMTLRDVLRETRPAPLLVVATATEWPNRPEGPAPYVTGDPALAHEMWANRAHRLGPCPFLVLPDQPADPVADPVAGGHVVGWARVLCYWVLVLSLCSVPLMYVGIKLILP